MQVQRNTSDKLRMQFLNTSLPYMRRCIEGGGFVPFAGVYLEMNDLHEKFSEALMRLIKAKSEYQLVTTHKNRMARDLGRSVRDFMATAERRSKRYNYPGYILDLFQNCIDGGQYPSPKNLEGWALVAKSLIGADEHVQKDGFPAMHNPGAAELEDYVSKYDAVCSEQLAKSLEFTEAQEALAKLRIRVDEVTRELYFYLRGWFSREKPSRARQYMRSFGYRFKSGKKDES